MSVTGSEFQDIFNFMDGINPWLSASPQHGSPGSDQTAVLSLAQACYQGFFFFCERLRGRNFRVLMFTETL